MVYYSVLNFLFPLQDGLFYLRISFLFKRAYNTMFLCYSFGTDTGKNILISLDDRYLPLLSSQKVFV